MASTFDDVFETNLAPDLRDYFGEVVTYTVDANPLTLVAVVSDEQVDEQTEETGRRARYFRNVEIPRDPAAPVGDFVVDANGIETPRMDATLLIQGVLYAVEGIVEQSVYRTTLRVVRVESLEYGRQKYRG
jgi:hypothetical protein